MHMHVHTRARARTQPGRTKSGALQYSTAWDDPSPAWRPTRGARLSLAAAIRTGQRSVQANEIRGASLITPRSR